MKVWLQSLMILVILMVAVPGYAQKRDLVAQADKVFGIGEYFKAIDKYSKAYSKEKDKVRKTEIRYKIGHCYRLTNNTRKAETYYAQVVRRKFPDPAAHYYYAEMLKVNGKIEAAKEAFQEYLKVNPGDAVALLSFQTCDSIKSWMENPTRYEVANMKDFNSRDNDFSPFFASKDYRELYFTSSREGAEGNKIHGATGESFSDIFYTRLDNKQKWSQPSPLDKTINSMYDDGAPWISPDGSTMYFTRCRFDRQEELGCQILEAKRNGGKWAEPTVLPISKDSVVVAHPTLTSDQLTMYFISDMLGGEGGKDIWMVKRESTAGAWGAPENLGSVINTPKDEMFPNIRHDSILYFSSNGHPGMGGLDIFKAFKNEEDKWVIENMKYPVNSSADDFGIVFQTDDERGYFTSDRKEGSKGGDDIFSFFLPQVRFNLAGTVINEKTELAVKEAEIRLIGSDGTSLEFTTDTTGKFSFKLKPQTDYIVVAFKKGFLNGKIRETTMGIEENRDFNVSLMLAPIEKPVELPNILYDLAKWDLRPESMVALDLLVETLEDNPNITIELMSHTDIRPFRTMTNLELSQLRAQSVVDFLISKGIQADRLVARGYGPEVPRVVDERIKAQYDFLQVMDTLTRDYIDKLRNDQIREVAHQLNRRTEFRVLRTDYIPKELKEKGIDVEQQLIDRGLEELQKGIDPRKKRTAEEIEAIKNQTLKQTGGQGSGGGGGGV